MLKYIMLFIAFTSVSGCSLFSESKYDLAVNEAYELEKKRIAEFENKRVQKELSSWQ